MEHDMSDLKDQILNLKREISTLEDDVERLSAMEQAVKIVLNGKQISAVVKPI